MKKLLTLILPALVLTAEAATPTFDFGDVGNPAIVHGDVAITKNGSIALSIGRGVPSAYRVCKKRGGEQMLHGV